VLNSSKSYQKSLIDEFEKNKKWKNMLF
jgi:hypothetical protein